MSRGHTRPRRTSGGMAGVGEVDAGYRHAVGGAQFGPSASSTRHSRAMIAPAHAVDYLGRLATSDTAPPDRGWIGESTTLKDTTKRESLVTSPGDCALVMRPVCSGTGVRGRCQTAIVRIDNTPRRGVRGAIAAVDAPVARRCHPRSHPHRRLSPVMGRTRAEATGRNSARPSGKIGLRGDDVGRARGYNCIVRPGA